MIHPENRLQVTYREQIVDTESKQITICPESRLQKYKLLMESRSLTLTVSRSQSVQRADYKLLMDSRSLTLTVSRPQCIERTDYKLLMVSRSFKLKPVLNWVNICFANIVQGIH